MNEKLQVFADSITAAAGWKPACPTGGRYVFSLEGDLDVVLWSPDQRTGIFLADMGAVPAEPGEREALFSALASDAVGRMHGHASTLAVAGDRIELYRTFIMSDPVLVQPNSPLPDMMRDFLNDLAWWKERLYVHQHPQPPFQPFMMNAVCR